MSLDILKREFALLDEDHDGLVSFKEVVEMLDEVGLREDDPRLQPLFENARRKKSASVATNCMSGSCQLWILIDC